MDSFTAAGASANAYDVEALALAQAAVAQGRRASASSLFGSKPSSSPRLPGSAPPTILARRRASSGAPEDLIPESATMIISPVQATPPGAPPDFVANHHRHTSGSSRGSAGRGNGVFGRRKRDSKRSGTSDEDSNAQDTAKGEDAGSAEGAIVYSPSGGIGHVVPSGASPTIVPHKGWLARRSHSGASKSSNGSPRPPAIEGGKAPPSGGHSREQSGGSHRSRHSAKSGAGLSLVSPVDFAAANSRKSPLSPNDGSMSWEKIDRQSGASSPSTSQRASDPFSREGPVSSLRSEASSDSRYSLQSTSHRSDPASNSSSGPPHDEPLQVPARTSSMKASQHLQRSDQQPAPAEGTPQQAWITHPPTTSSHSGRHSPQSSTSSYPASPTDDAFPQSLAAPQLTTVDEATSPLDSGASEPTEPTPQTPPPLDSGSLLSPSSAPLSRDDSGAEYYTPIPAISPGALGLLQGVGNAAKDHRGEGHEQNALEAEKNPFDQGVEARDLAAEYQARLAETDSGAELTETLRSEGPIENPSTPNLGVPPIPMRVSTSHDSKLSRRSGGDSVFGRPSPSPSEDARRLADVYGMYGVDDASIKSQSQEMLSSFPLNAQGSVASRHSREPAQTQRADELFTNAGVEPVFKDPDASMASTKAGVFDELDAMLGQAMEDAQKMRFSSVPTSAASLAVPVGDGTRTSSPEATSQISSGASVEYMDAAAESNEPGDLSFEEGAPEILTTVPIDVVEARVHEPAFVAEDVEPSIPAAPTGSQPAAEMAAEQRADMQELASTPLHTPTAAEFRMADVDRSASSKRDPTSSTISPPLSPSTPRRHASLSARPAAVRSPSVTLVQQQSAWQAKQQRQAQAAEKLRRNRPLPPAMEYSDIKKLRTSAERAKAHATRINELVKVDTGLDLWLERMRDQRSAQPSGLPPRTGSRPSMNGQNASPTTLRSAPSVRSNTTFTGAHPRDVSTAASIMSFPIRPDAVRAVEISHDAPAPNNLMAPTSLPFPGVYRPTQPSPGLTAFTSGGSSGSNSIRTSPNHSFSSVSPTPPIKSGGTPPMPAAAVKTATFLTNLGRKASRRSGPSRSPQLQMSQPPNEAERSPMPRTATLAGPRGPRPGGYVAQTPSPRPTSTIIANGAAGESPAHSPHRTSFAYGTTSQPDADTTPKRVVKTTTSGSRKDAVFEHQLDKLSDILPQVSRETLSQFLQQEGGDDLAAISAYLEAEKEGRL